MISSNNLKKGGKEFQNEVEDFIFVIKGLFKAVVIWEWIYRFEARISFLKVVHRNYGWYPFKSYETLEELYL